MPLIVSTGINSIRLGTSFVSGVYIGEDQIWPPLPASGIFWSNFLRNSCVTLNITSSRALPTSGVVWGDGTRSGISLGAAIYKKSFGTGLC